MPDGADQIDSIASDRLTLRAPAPSDAGLISLYMGDPRVARMLTAAPHPFPPGAAEALIERARKSGESARALLVDAYGFRSVAACERRLVRWLLRQR